MENLFHVELPFLNLAIRAVAVYLVVLLLLRISGKRQMGQMNATEFVAILLISNAVQNSMNGGDNSLVGGLFLAMILIGMSTLISYLTFRSKIASTIFEGSPVLLIHKGKLLTENVKKELLSTGEIKTLLRKQGFHKISDIQVAVLEADGTLSITGNHTMLEGEDPMEHMKASPDA